jgi:hypothetical protein
MKSYRIYGWREGSPRQVVDIFSDPVRAERHLKWLKQRALGLTDYELVEEEEGEKKEEQDGAAAA